MVNQFLEMLAVFFVLLLEGAVIAGLILGFMGPPFRIKDKKRG